MMKQETLRCRYFIKDINYQHSKKYKIFTPGLRVEWFSKNTRFGDHGPFKQFSCNILQVLLCNF